ncbi:Bud site selection protein 6 [Polyrhizophydium stewartii]|uniref:Bud site selection protein 6 n=1 Tax=Polyrhizophydium stewartii TaxID=2732419 RepID=A0ABR4NEI3_9FUNG
MAASARKPALSDPLTAGLLASRRLLSSLDAWNPSAAHHADAVDRSRADLDTLVAAIKASIGAAVALSATASSTATAHAAPASSAASPQSEKAAALARLRRLHLAPDQILRLFDALVAESPLGPSVAQRRVVDAIKTVHVDLDQLRSLSARQQESPAQDTHQQHQQLELHPPVPRHPPRRAAREHSPVAKLTRAAEQSQRHHNTSAAHGATAAAPPAVAVTQASWASPSAGYGARSDTPSSGSIANGGLVRSWSVQSSTTSGAPPTDALALRHMQHAHPGTASAHQQSDHHLRPARSTIPARFAVAAHADRSPRTSPAMHSPSAVHDPPALRAASTVVASAAESPRPQHPLPAPPQLATLFLTLDKVTRKVEVTLPVTSQHLRALFLEKFGRSGLESDSRDMLIKHPTHGESYLLEGMSDVRDGSAISLSAAETVSQPSALDAAVASIQQRLDEMLAAVESKIEAAALKHAQVHVPDTQRLVADQHSIAGSLATEPSEFDSDRDEDAAHARNNDAAPRPTDWQHTRCPTSKTLADTIAKVEALQREHRTARRDMSDFVRHFSAVLEQALGQVAHAVVQASRDSGDSAESIDAHATAPRKPLHTALDAISDDSERLEDRANALRFMLDMLRVDATRRVSIPREQVDQARAHIADLAASIQVFSGSILRTKAMCKSVWETELQRIVDEQAFVKDQEAFAAGLRTSHADLEDLVTAIDRVVQASYAPCTDATDTPSGRARRGPAIVLDVIPADEAKTHGIQSVLAELQLRSSELEGQSERRVAILQQMDTVRPILAEATRFRSPFEQELSRFVSSGKLRAGVAGGIDEIERRRRQRDAEMIASFFRENKRTVRRKQTASVDTSKSGATKSARQDSRAKHPSESTQTASISDDMPNTKANECSAATMTDKPTMLRPSLSVSALAAKAELPPIQIAPLDFGTNGFSF